MIHSGSRGLGHQVATDALVEMERAMARDEIQVNDRQLACARIQSAEGQNYLKAMACAANYAWVNRSAMTFLCRQVRQGTRAGRGPGWGAGYRGCVTFVGIVSKARCCFDPNALQGTQPLSVRFASHELRCWRTILRAHRHFLREIICCGFVPFSRIFAHQSPRFLVRRSHQI